MDIAQARLLVIGKVQGVFYRHSTKQAAQSFGLTGWVKNLPDGSVEVFACGAESAIKNLVEWCHKGPPNAVVSKVNVEWVAADDLVEEAGTTGSVFEIR